MSSFLINNCLKFSLASLFMLFLQLSHAQKSIKEFGLKEYAKTDAIISQKQKQIGEDMVAIIWTDTLGYKKEIGDFNSKTLVPIASCSKWLTTALVLQLVDEGKISLDDKISKYLPIFESYGKSYITIRHCLSHMTGIQSEPIKLVKLLEKKKFDSLEDEVTSFAKKEIQSNPGLEFRYSNMGINIAARVVEVVTRKKFDLLIRQKLFIPLGMRSSTFSTADNSAPNPSGGAKSTADEYMNFLVMLLDNGMYKGKRILSENSVAEMRKLQTSTSQVKYAPKSAEGFNYALGSWVLEDDGKGNATALTSPGLFGTWPMIDWKRGYAAIFFVKNFLGEQKADTYLEIKKVIDQEVK